MFSINYTNHVPNINYTPFSQKIAGRFIPYYTLNSKLESIRQRVSSTSKSTLNASELTDVKEAFINCNNLFAGKLLKNLTQLPLSEVKKSIFKAFDQENEAKIRACLVYFLESLREEDLIHFSGISSDRLEEAFKKSVLLQDKALNSVLYSKGKAVWKELYYEISYFCHHLIETFISVTGFTEIGNKRRNAFEGSVMDSYEAQRKIEIYVAFLTYPSILFASFFAITRSVALAGIATSIIIAASILFIPIYMRYLKPCPNQYMGLDNLNQKVLRNENPPPFHRIDILNQIQNAFYAGKGVILTGDSGAGKTSIVDSLASLIVLKKAKDGAEFLNEAQIFSANANQFKTLAGGDNLSFQSLAEHFKNHKKSFVLFIDEVASLYIKDTLTGSSDKSFLTFLDKYPYVICATTIKEYNELIKNDDPSNRRLVHIEIKPLKPKELESALYQYLHYKAPELILEDNIISYIVEKAKEFNPKTSQIDGAMSLLKRLIIKATHITFEKLEKKVNDLKLEIEYLEHHLLHSDQTDSTIKINQYSQKKMDLKTAQEKLLNQLKILNQIKKIESIRLQVKSQGYSLAAKVKATTTDHLKEWRINYATHQILTDFLINKRNELGLPTSINKALIDNILEERKCSQPIKDNKSNEPGLPTSINRDLIDNILDERKCSQPIKDNKSNDYIDLR